MNPNLQKIPRDAWAMLTDVPGHPDATSARKALRATPVIVPLVVVVCIIAWLYLVHKPEQLLARSQAESLLQLEQEIANHSTLHSDAQASEFNAAAIEARKLLSTSLEERTQLLNEIRSLASHHGWSAKPTLGTYPDPTYTGQSVAFVTAGTLLSPEPDNATPLNSLLQFAEGSSRLGKRIDMSRLVIRANDQGLLTAEASFEIAIPSPDEKGSE